ncbi:MAG: T9SS type A sorting domain-containing protein [Spirosomataceae bacterium]
MGVSVFIDLDGAINAVEVQNLPNWLKFEDNTFRGTPPQIGNFTMTLRAIDDDGAWVETNFTIVVDNQGRINQRPILRKNIPDVIGLYKQPFILTLSDSSFFDADGFINRLEITGLPPWAQYRKGEIRGLADAVGEYLISVRAFDDEEADVTTTFKIIINYPTVLFDLIQAGKPGQRFLIKRLKDKETLLGADLPASLNIYANCDAIFDAFDLSLTGPYTQISTTDRSPYALFEGDGGFVPTAGYYFLKGTAYLRKELIASTNYQFEIVPSDAITKQRIPIDDWAVYPNPCRDFVNIKLPYNMPLKQYELATLVGQKVIIPDKLVFQTGTFVSLNLGQLNIQAGIYLLKIQNEDTSWRVFKIVKQ